jgi:hypothetical protein
LEYLPRQSLLNERHSARFAKRNLPRRMPSVSRESRMGGQGIQEPPQVSSPSGYLEIKIV